MIIHLYSYQGIYNPELFRKYGLVLVIRSCDPRRKSWGFGGIHSFVHPKQLTVDSQTHIHSPCDLRTR